MRHAKLVSLVRAVLVACGLFGLLLPSARAVTVTVSGTGYSSLDNGVNQIPFDIVTENNPNGSKSVTGSGFERATNASEPILSFAQAAGEGSAFAAPGVLKARVASSADNMSFIPQVPFLIYTPRVVANFGASFSDSITLTHPTLPAGSPVDYRITLHIEAPNNHPGHIGPPLNPFYSSGTFALQFAVGQNVGTNYFFPNFLYTTLPALDFDQEFVTSGLVGDHVTVYTSLGVGAENRAGADPIQGAYGNHQETIIDASNTVEVFIDPITSGLGIASESGHDYSTVVPEPATLSLLVIGLIAGTAAARSIFHHGRMPTCTTR